jgi:type IV pilus assembly protein PilC
MSSYSYVAVDPHGSETRGTLDVTDQSEALRRIREMGLFPTKVLAPANRRARSSVSSRPRAARTALRVSLPGFGGRVKPARLAIFTRQLATLVEAGMPLVRSLRVLQEQEENPTLKRVIEEVSESIENGSSLAEAVKGHPRVFNRLYVNMVLAGEVGGALEVTLQRLAEFMEKAQRIKGKVKAALLYPAAVLTVAGGILVLMMTFIVPRFKAVFADLMQGAPLPAFTVFIFRISEALTHQLPYVLAGVAAAGALFALALQTVWGRWVVDRLKLSLPVLGPLFRKAAVSRFARTLGTLASNGVPILQALTIVKETAGDLVVGRVIGQVHDNVKQGDPIAPTLKSSGVFPAMVAGMVDVGEQTGALPEMLLKVADNYDNEVDNAASALASLLEPVMIVILAVIVGSIVVAMFLPLITVCTFGFDGPGKQGE